MAQRTVSVTALLGMCLAVLALVLPAARAAQAQGAAPRGPAARVVVIGVPGLRWSDLGPAATPTLWRMTTEGSAAALSAKAVQANTCPIDGWLTVSAGQRSRLHNGGCALPPAPQVRGERAAVPGFTAMRDDNAQSKYGAQLGLLGDAVHRAKGCTMAVGPGAAFGAMDGGGRVDVYSPAVDRVPAADWSRCALTVVDVDDIFRAYIDAGVDVNGSQVGVSDRQRAAAATAADQRVSRVLTQLPAGSTVLLAGLADSGSAAHLHVAIATGPAFAGHYLTAGSTHTGGLVALTDVTSTALHVLRLHQSHDAVGSPWQAGSVKPATARAVRHLDEKDVAARASDRLSTPYFVALAVIQVALYVFAWFVLRRKGRGRLAALRVVALAVAAVPAGTYLANLVPWAKSSHPLLAFMGSVLAAVAVLTGLSVAGRWRRSLIVPGAVIGVATAFVLTVDVMSGSHLQTDDLLGYTPLLAARFYGFASDAWAVWVTGAVIATGAVAQRLLCSHGRSVAAGFVLAVGVAVMIVDGAPMLGADFGGMVAIIPGFALFALLISGRRVTLTQAVAVLGVAVIVVLGVSWIDSLRASPTHMGEFWRQLVHGNAGTIVLRRVRTVVGTFGDWQLTVITVAALGFWYFFLVRAPVEALRAAYERAPALRATLITAIVTAIIGTLASDSGISVAALALSVAIPLALAAIVRGSELDAAREGTRRPRRPEARSAPTG